MNLYLSEDHVENWSECWQKSKPDTYLTLYDEDNSAYAFLEDIILRCPNVYRKLVQVTPTVLLTIERNKDQGKNSPLIFPTATGFLEDTIYELFSSGENFQDVNESFLSDVILIKRLALRGRQGKVQVNLFLLGKTIEFDAFKVWKNKLQKSLKGKSSLVEIRIYIFNNDCIRILPLCEGLSVLNLKQDPHLKYIVFQKLKYMFVRNHVTDCVGPCKLVSAIGRIVYLQRDLLNDDDDDPAVNGSCFKIFTHKRQIEVLSHDHSILRRKKEELENRLLCKICLDRQLNVLCLPCKHLSACLRCHLEIKNRIEGNAPCPICREKVDKYVTNIYL